MDFLLAVLYIIGSFIAFFIICYRGAKKEKGNDKYTYKPDEFDVFLCVLWPVVAIITIIVSPFSIIKNVAIRLKNINNPKEIDLYKINNE